MADRLLKQIQHRKTYPIFSKGWSPSRWLAIGGGVNVILLVIFMQVFSACSQKKTKNIVEYQLEFTNPILHLDYSDPDVVEVNGMYYMTASSFNCVPALPLLQSNNLIDWELVGYAISELEPKEYFDLPQHGNGVWAPSIRYHNDKFYIYYGDPDFGIYMLTANDIKGPWTKPHLVKAGKGWIDPCPFWDNDGKAWLIHAWAGSRAGIKSTLTLHKMSSDGKSLLDNGTIIFDGHKQNRTVEGPKMYKRNGYYYVFAPAGGVAKGWQLALRSKNALGPYEVKKVLHQGNTEINGPHQGALVDNFDSTSWFIHFQDKEAYGRIVHLQPVKWVNDWPVIGNDENGDGCGEPVVNASIQSRNYEQKNRNDVFSDEFNTPYLNKNWQWHANPQPEYGAPTGYLGYLRLNAKPVQMKKSLWGAADLLLQKFPAEEFECSAKIELNLHENKDRTGLLIMGSDYAYIGIEKDSGLNKLVYRICKNADKDGVEKTVFNSEWTNETVYLKVKVQKGAICTFFYSSNERDYNEIQGNFRALPGKWIGAKTGVFCVGDKTTNDAGFVNVDWFRVKVFN